MLVTVIIFLLFLFYLLIETKKAIIISYPFSLLFTTLPLFSFDKTHIGLSFSIFTSVILASSGNFYLLKKNPFFPPIILILLGILLSWYFGEDRSSVYVVFSSIITTVVPLFIYPYLRTPNDVKLFIKSFIIVISLAVLYSIVEFINGRNIWMYWLQNQTNATIFHDHINDIRFGYGRCNSFFDFPIPFGDVCAMMFCFILFYYNSYINPIYSRFHLSIIMVLMVIGLFLSNSRAPLLAIAIGILHYPVFRNKKTLFIASVFVLFIFVFAYDSLVNVYDSMVGENGQEFSGSTTNLRINQYMICLDAFNRNPIFGGGFNAFDRLHEMAGTSQLMGAESILFVLMVTQGLAGLLPYFFSHVYVVWKFPKGTRLFPLTFSLAWLAASLASLTTGVTLTFPLLLLLAVYRSYELGLIKRK